MAHRGFVTWNVEYRRVGPSGGGWPTTCDDVAVALDAVSADELVDPDRLVVVGHSAGAQLACWSVQRRGGARAPSATPALIVSLAGVLDMNACARRGLGDTGNAAVAFMGAEPEATPEDYRCASPITCLPLRMPQIVAQGLRDSADLVEMSAAYARSARRMGEHVVHLEFAEADHFTVIDPSSSAWTRIAAEIESIVPPGP
jgi:acetyl esterase/lipase